MLKNSSRYSISEDLPKTLIKSILENENIAVFFDKNLVYQVVNKAACEQLKKNPEDLLGKCIIDLYPRIIASSNHRNLLKALTGQMIQNTIIEAAPNTFFYSSYLPVYQNETLIGVHSWAILCKQRINNS